MKWALAISAGLLVAFGIVLHFQWFPLGVPSEWDWERLPPAALPAWSAFLPALLLGGALVTWLAAGARWVETARPARFFGGLMATAAMAGIFQVALEVPAGRGLGKWMVAVYAPQVTGFFQVARFVPSRVAEVFQEYPNFIRWFDAAFLRRIDPPFPRSAPPASWLRSDWRPSRPFAR